MSVLMPWLHVKRTYFKIISAFVDVRLKYFFSAWKLGGLLWGVKISLLLATLIQRL